MCSYLVEWSKNVNALNQQVFVFDDVFGIQDDHIQKFTIPAQFYCKFLTNDLLNLILVETNKYGERKFLYWPELVESEFLKFLAIFLHMEIEKRLHLKDYLSTRIVFSKLFASEYMSRNRFVQLLNCLKKDNFIADCSNWLNKINSVIKILNQTFSEVYKPREYICINESVVLFRLIFRQYIKGKRHKYGIKLYNLCFERIYTNKFIVYAGKNLNKSVSTMEIVMDLIENFLESGKKLCIDNFYTSLPLTHKLLEKKTHLIDTLRKNKIPQDAIQKKLKRKELIARQNKSGVTVLKFKDKRDVLMLSTMHTDIILPSQKPEIIY